MCKRKSQRSQNMVNPGQGSRSCSLERRQWASQFCVFSIHDLDHIIQSLSLVSQFKGACNECKPLEKTWKQIKEKEVVLGHTEPLVVAVIPVVIILEALVPSTVCSHPVLTLTSKRYSVLSAPESPRPCLSSPTITITSYCSPIS